MDSITTDILIAVYMITYNHDKYILQSVESVMSQKTNFSYKLFIGDDKSLDNTVEIIKSLAKRYPGKIDLIANEINLGASKNAINIFNKCLNSGAKYIAILEGDDYWTDVYKLQKQVDFLEHNPAYSICWTKATYYDTVSNKQCVPESFELSLNGNPHYTIGLNSFYDKYVTATLTTVFVASELSKFDLNKFPYLNDSVIFFILLSQGKGALLNFNSAVYRIHSGGMWNSASLYTKKINYFYALDSAMKVIPGLAAIEHLAAWRKWNLLQAYYLMAEDLSAKEFKTFILLFYSILKYHNRVEKKKALKTLVKSVFKW